MFVFVSMLISIGILAAMLFFSRQKQTGLQRKYELLVDLRKLLNLCRQHRSATHYALTSQYDPKSELVRIEDQLIEQSNHLVATAQFENRPMYRILQLKLKELSKDWRDRTVARNQMMHGKVIRQCMFLMDEIALAWLVESGREDLSDEYHTNWQQVIDAMEALTQLRIAIQDLDNDEGRLRLNYYCDRMRRKLNQLALISPLSIASPTCSKAMHVLSEMHDNSHMDISSEEMYRVSSDISLSICQVYDQVLSDITESLYLPLPKMALV
ncbi:hypothetical protein [Vibrio sp.]|uniref:hypothetical protein n=1 Tax=Vibrio sp. TaxID=678 RepID=UPI003D12DD2D